MFSLPSFTRCAGGSSCGFQGDGAAAAAAARMCGRGHGEPWPTGQRQPRCERGKPGLRRPPAVQVGPPGGQRKPSSSAKQTERHTAEATWRWGGAVFANNHIRVTCNYSSTLSVYADLLIDMQDDKKHVLLVDTITPIRIIFFPLYVRINV